MKEYTGEKILKKVVCNKCGRKLLVENGILKEDVFEGKHVFGYFSNKDGMKQQFELCEACYTKMTAEFIIPVKESEKPELL